MTVANLATHRGTLALGLAVIYTFLQDIAALGATGCRDGVRSEEGNHEGCEDDEFHDGRLVIFCSYNITVDV